MVPTSPSYQCFHEVRYQCKNCGGASVTYFLALSEAGEDGLILKVGQYPPLEIDPCPELRLGSEDLDLYKKALTSRNFSFGIGALSYLRRVVENRMNGLLDLVVAAAQSSGVGSDKLAGLDDVKSSRRFEDKVDFAARILPNNLKPHGHNPFDVLHDFASEGLHAKSDEECLVIFDNVKVVFEYLFRNLTFTDEEAENYARTLGHLTGKKQPGP